MGGTSVGEEQERGVQIRKGEEVGWLVDLKKKKGKRGRKKEKKKEKKS